MVNLTLDLDTAALASTLDVHRRRLSGVTYRALNDTAGLVVLDEQGEMRRVFDRPTPYTINSLRISQYARRDNLQVIVDFKDRLASAKSNPPERWVGVQVRGGLRPQKRSERRLSYRRGNQAYFMVPTRYAQLDQYGNVSRGLIVKILSQLDALEQGSNRNRARQSRGRRAREEYFAIYTKRPGLEPGIYQRKRTGFGAGVVPIFFFAKQAPSYQARFDFEGVGQRSVKANLPRVWREEWSRPAREDVS